MCLYGDELYHAQVKIKFMLCYVMFHLPLGAWEGLRLVIVALPGVGNQQQVIKYCGKEEKMLLRSNFSSFPQDFQYVSTVPSGVKLHIHLWNVVVRFMFSSLSFCSGLFYSWIWTCPLMQIGVQYKIKNRMANNVDSDETAHYEPSHLDLNCFATVFVLVPMVERVKSND